MVYHYFSSHSPSLSLHLPGAVLEDDRAKAHYNVDTGPYAVDTGPYAVDRSICSRQVHMQ